MTECQHVSCDDRGTELLELDNGDVYRLCEDHAHMDADGRPVGDYEPNNPEKFNGVTA